MLLVAKQNGFEIYFNANTQSYVVFRYGKFFIGNKYKFSDVKCYLD